MGKWLSAAEWIGWGALGILLPFTSLPLLANLRGSSMVAPPSAVALGILGLVWFIPYVLRKGNLPGQAMPLLGFFLIALLGCLFSLFLPLPAFKTITPLRNMLQAILTLVIGVSFFLLTSVWFQREKRLFFFLRIINWSGILIILWSGVQAWAWKQYLEYPEWMWKFQEQISSSYMLFFGRVTGFAYEPSWLGHQLNMLYLPFWLSASLNGFSAHRRLWKISFENILLTGGLITLWLSISRIGYLTFIAMAGFLFLEIYFRLVRWIRTRLFKTQTGKLFVFSASALISIFLLVVYIGLLFAAGYGLSKVDPRMATIFNFSALKGNPLFVYANQLVFAERLVFWEAGWGVFNDYPFLGVGLGNAGFFFPEKLNAFSWALTEISILVFRWGSIPNIKSLWVRLLAETGLIGFSTFIAWCFIMWISARYLMSGREKLLRVMGWTGCFVLSGLIVEGFNMDTFALPYFWVSLGIVAAACQTMRRRSRMDSEQEVGSLERG